MKIKIFYVIFILMMACRGGAIEAPLIHDEWDKCRQDNDCIKVYACSDKAINKKYAEEWRGKQLCTAALPADPKTEAACIKLKCALREIVKPSGLWGLVGVSRKSS